MKIHRYRSSQRRSSQHGQTLIPIVIFIGLFLMAMLGVAADYTQVWAHRQMAQGAADAACEAGAADLYLNAVDPILFRDRMDCKASVGSAPILIAPATSSPPCRYASLNGYSGASVHVSFPSSLPGVAPLPTALATAHPYVEVTITDPVSMSFTKMVGAASTVSIKAKAGCGVTPITVPVPLVVLHQTADAVPLDSGQRWNSNSRWSDSLRSGGLEERLGSKRRRIGYDRSYSSWAERNRWGRRRIRNRVAAGRSSVGHWQMDQSNLAIRRSLGPYQRASSPCDDRQVATCGLRHKWVSGPAGCVEFTAGDYSGTVSATNCATGNITYLNVNNEPNGCLILPVTLRMNDRSKNHAYNILGEVILPTNNNPGNFAYKVYDYRDFCEHQQ